MTTLFQILLLYLAASVVTFGAYTFDKSAARGGRWRVRESTLHILSLAGGWPGAVVAQRLFHHKTRKRSFRLSFWATVLINSTIVGLLALKL